MVILKLAGVDNRNDAEAMKNKDVFITEEDLDELPDDTFYIRDLIGLQAVDDSGRIGIVKDVLQPSAQDVYVIKTDSGRDILVPAVKEFVKEVNLEEGFIRLSLIEGMIEE